ncbi:MAG: sigma 54-interacting transcriptional regulator [Eubacterium sp.]|nr:sigma 54-interacting transcriptional regulator [Eubacterium sp.]
MKSKKDNLTDALKRETLPIKDIESIEDICINVVDKDGKIVCYSKGCALIEDMAHDEVVGKTNDELYEYVENESMQQYVLETGKTVRDVHVKYTSPSGRIADVISSTYPVFSEKDSGEVEAAICIYRDVSDYMRMARTIDKLQSALKDYQSSRDNGTQFTFKDVVGSSVATRECVRQAEIAAQTNASILIAGPTGSGKEVFAQSIHNASDRADHPFVAINCSAIPENLLESTLFGTVKGSFTGAVDAKGLLETAKGGTLFLDEINSMNLALQAKILRVLETKRYRKVGGNKELTMDVRVLSATNQDPLKAIEDNVLRSDLYYRLAVFSINLPPLCERRQDILDLAESILSAESVNMGKRLNSIGEEAKKILLNHDWPGNVRELKHVITQCIYMAKYQDAVLEPELLPEYLKKNYTDKRFAECYLKNTSDDKNLKHTLGRIERQILMDVLNEHHFNISKSAKALGISRQNLQYKIKLFNLEPEKG